MESILRDEIVNHLNKNNLIRASQHGFMSGRSCLTNLLEYLEDLTKFVDQGYAVDIRQGAPQEADHEVQEAGYQW